MYPYIIKSIYINIYAHTSHLSKYFRCTRPLFCAIRNSDFIQNIDKVPTSGPALYRRSLNQLFLKNSNKS